MGGSPIAVAGKRDGSIAEEKEQSLVATTVDVADEAKSNAELSEGMTPTQQLLYAAEKGDCALIRAAIKRGADVKVHDMGPKAQAEEKRAMDEAAGNKKSKKQLLKEEKEQETMFRDMPITEDTAMHKAAEKGHTDAVDLLFYAEADIEAKNRLGSTPLHRAVSAKQADVVSMLLRHGARLDATNAIGNTALHIASYQGDVDMATLLLSHAKHEAYRLVVAINQAGVSPIDYARKKQMHTLLSSHRLLSSANSSFIRHPAEAHSVNPTPKNGRMLIPHASGGDAAPTLSRPGSWKTGGSDDSKSVSHHRDDHAAAAHHHAPNPPINRTHSGGQSFEHGHLSAHTTPSVAARPLDAASAHHAHESKDSNKQQQPAYILPATVPSPAASAADSLLSGSPAFNYSDQPTPTHHSSHSTVPPLPQRNDTPEPPNSASASSEQPSLLNKPSFEKTSSLDSHPLDSDTRQGSMSTVGQMVSPVLQGRGGGEGGQSGSMSVDPAARGVSMAGLSLNMLPNECAE